MRTYAQDGRARATSRGCGSSRDGCRRVGGSRATPKSFEYAERRSSLSTHRSGLLARENMEEPPNGGLHLRARRDQIDHPVLDEELRRLEALRKCLANRLFDDARSGEAD